MEAPSAVHRALHVLARSGVLAFITLEPSGWSSLRQVTHVSWHDQMAAAHSNGFLETEIERKLGLYWEGEPFETVNHALERFLGPADDVNPLLQYLGPDEDDDPSEKNSSREYLALFDPLFRSPLPSLEGKQLENVSFRDKKRNNFAITLAYRGSTFCGWQSQHNNNIAKPSVQGSLQHALAPLVATAGAGGSMLLPDIRVCGRTDAGVSALGQLCRLRTPPNVTCDMVRECIDHSSSDGTSSPHWRCINVRLMDDSFHPTFGATCRAYVYLIDFQYPFLSRQQHVEALNAMLQPLEGRELDYRAMSFGKIKTQTTLCTLHWARASIVETCASSSTGTAICIQLVGDRFLRRMVRILVATALREALEVAVDENSNSSEDDASSRLLDIVQGGDRRRRAAPAPPDGLIFVGARFGNNSRI